MTDDQARDIVAEIDHDFEYLTVGKDEVGQLLKVVEFLRQREDIMLDSQRMRFVEAALGGLCANPNLSRNTGRWMAENSVGIADTTMKALGLDGGG